MNIRIFIKTLLLFLFVTYIVKSHLIFSWTRVSRCERISFLETKFSFVSLPCVYLRNFKCLLYVAQFLTFQLPAEGEVVSTDSLLQWEYLGFSKAVVLEILTLELLYYEKLLKTSKNLCLYVL